MSVERGSVTEQPRKQKGKLFRRAIAHVGLAGLALSSMAACDLKPSATPEPTPTPISSVVDNEANKNMDHIVTPGGIRVDFALDQLPLQIPIEVTLPDGKKVSLDKEEVLESRDNAIQNKEPQLISIFPLDTSYDFRYSSEHPKTSELPDDVLSEEELESKGVKIVQADNTDLHIRKSAFEKGGLLADFNNTGRKLTIVLANVPYIINGGFKWDSVNGTDWKIYIPNIEAQKSAIDAYRAEMLSKFEGELENQIQDESAQEASSKIIRLKTNVFFYKNLLTDSQIAEEIASSSQKEVAGIYLLGVGGGEVTMITGGKTTVMIIECTRDGCSTTQKIINDEEKRVTTRTPYNDSTIVVAVGKTFQEFEGLFFDESGNLAPVEGRYGGSGLNSGQTYPDPSNFKLNPNASDEGPDFYPYAGQTPGFVLRHEIDHDRLMAQQWNEGGAMNMNEYDTDMRAMEGVRQAWEKWVKSGYKDNTGFPFVLRLPDGTYILTRKKKSGKSLRREHLRARRLNRL